MKNWVKFLIILGSGFLFWLAGSGNSLFLIVLLCYMEFRVLRKIRKV